MAEATGDTYLAGLWNNNLIQGLYWINCKPPCTRAELVDRLSSSVANNDIGPSWSWTHCSGVDFPFVQSGTTFSVESNAVKATFTPENADLNPYGRLKEGRLNVNGKVIKLPRTRRRDADYPIFSTWHVIHDSGADICHVD
jgi:hypothetical protein